jgi:DNA-directed RNA polymerase specialized sigma24 family protein
MLQAAAQSHDVATSTVNGPDLPYLSRQLLAQVAQRVPARELEIAVLQRLDGLSQQELSEVMGISDRTARRLLKKFDERLERIRKEA